ncbi:MAG TPA: maleylpyruvate isomerase family mycothiol-dependent enzyme [Mycobacteriales bacterium]|nr:maleylpyruvate isomerase family mycothiol-dependent enzyme [Mycobacteriales bacterium]
MSTTAITTTPTPSRRRPALDRATAMRLAAEEYVRYTSHLRDLTPEQWEAPTCCAGWDVRKMVCHTVGMAEFAASPVEQMRQMRAAKRQGGLFIDALAALQVAKHAHQSPDELIATMAEVGPRAARGRRRTPAPLRRLVGIESHADAAGRETESWSLGYLVDVILTRDTWMHRSDIAAATGTAMRLTPDHDGRIVDDVVREWAGRHGRPYRLTLTSPAGGEWGTGPASDAPVLELDAVEFCRLLTGRGVGEGLLATHVPF